MTRNRIAIAFAVSIAALAWLLPPLGARTAAPTPSPTLAGDGQDEPGDAPRIYYKAPISADAAAVWIKLQKKAPIQFAQETPLEDFLKAIKAACADKDDPDALTIYVDPVGLQEAEKTMASPVTLDLGKARLETALTLALKQLDLTFSVHPDGIVYITSATSKDNPDPDVNALILDRLDALQKQVAELKALVGPAAAKK